MVCTVEIGGNQIQLETREGIDISIPLSFQAKQLKFFGVPKGTAKAYTENKYIGSTLRGGGCNVDSVSFIPHCHMTHTECVGHIVHENIFVNQLLINGFKTAGLITVTPSNPTGDDESNLGKQKSSDVMIPGKSVENALKDLPYPVEVLVVRTLPNDSSKLTKVYSEKDVPPYFTLDAIECLKQNKIEHLCIDLPSLDRTNDGGLLASHHLFWDVPLGEKSLKDKAPSSRTITELAYIPPELKDGFYVINLQVSNFVLDAAPSRPVLYPVTL